MPPPRNQSDVMQSRSDSRPRPRGEAMKSGGSVLLAILLGTTAIAAQGYRTGFIGKWHLDGGPRLPGFVPPGPRRQGFAFWAANECDHRHFRPSYFRDTDRPITEERFEPEVWTDRAIEFVKDAR